MVNILKILSNPFTHDPRVYNESCSLVKAGHNATVLAWDRSGQSPMEETKDGVNIIRVRNTMLMDFLPYDLFRLRFWWKEGYKKALELYKKLPFNVIHCHNLDTLPIGVKLKKRLGLPLVYDAHEIWGYMISRDVPKLLASYYLWKEKNIIDFADKIITVNEPLKDYFSKITGKEITIVMNCKHLIGTKYKSNENEKFTLLYIGTLSKSRFLTELVDVVEELPDIHCIIGGIGKPDHIKRLEGKCSPVKNVDFLGKIPFKEVVPMTLKADVIVCMTSPDDPNNSRALANKQFEAMVCGRPIICTKETYPGIFTEKLNCGLTSYYDKKSLKEAIKKLRDDPKLCEELGKKALNSAIKEYNWEIQEKKLFFIYNKIGAMTYKT